MTDEPQPNVRPHTGRWFEQLTPGLVGRDRRPRDAAKVYGQLA